MVDGGAIWQIALRLVEKQGKAIGREVCSDVGRLFPIAIAPMNGFGWGDMIAKWVVPGKG